MLAFFCCSFLLDLGAEHEFGFAFDLESSRRDVSVSARCVCVFLFAIVLVIVCGSRSVCFLVVSSPSVFFYPSVLLMFLHRWFAVPRFPLLCRLSSSFFIPRCRSLSSVFLFNFSMVCQCNSFHPGLFVVLRAAMEAIFVLFIC